MSSHVSSWKFGEPIHWHRSGVGSGLMRSTAALWNRHRPPAISMDRVAGALVTCGWFLSVVFPLAGFPIGLAACKSSSATLRHQGIAIAFVSVLTYLMWQAIALHQAWTAWLFTS
jgi:hypothetical protein